MSEARTLSLEDIQEGQTYTEDVSFSEELLEGFITLSQDRALAHVDSDHAARMGYDSGRIVHGLLVSMPYSRILGMFLPGSNTVIHQFSFDALAPVTVGDRLTYTVKVSRVVTGVKTVVLALEATNQDGVLVNRGRATCTFRL
jgi:3-hydroxybutyryl-CoA dehydratase